MCGICGIVDQAGRPVDPDLVRRMAAVMRHRGPDGEGFVFDPPAAPTTALAARRLAIIDLPGGDQPIANEDGSIHVAYNGEIYNFQALKTELEALGHRFRTHCDTEVVVHAYEAWGDDCVRRFNGMFAFAVWDARRRRLLLARDRMGEKPLSYAIRDGRIWFASEIKCLLEDPSLPRALDPEALLGFLTFFAVPEPLSLFQGVRKLPAAHVLVFEDGEARVSRYWDIPCGEEEREATEAEWAERVESLVEDAVRIRLMSDVPLGAFLSGGVDSGLVVAMMSRGGGDVTTFNVAFPPGYSEAAGARAVAQRFGTRHHEHAVVATRAWEDLERMVWHHDEPSQSLAQGWYVSGCAREHVTVALSGLGGDELFSGYPSHRAAVRWARLDRIPDGVWRGLGALAGLAPGGGARRVARLADSALLSPDERFATRYLQATLAEDREALVSEGLRRAAALDGPSGYLRSHFDACRAGDFLNRVLQVDQRTYLPNELLRTADSMSMAHSLEVRAPLLDHRLVELAARMPASLKLRGERTKRPLRDLAARLLPPQLAEAPKRGFTVPLAKWLSAGAEEFVRDHLSPATVRRRGLLDPTGVDALLDRHFRGQGSHEHWILALLGLELWHRHFLDRTP